MPSHQVLDLPVLFAVGLAGLFLGGVISFIADLLLYDEGSNAYISSTYCGHRPKWIEVFPFLPVFLQQGNCSGCRARVKWQYPMAQVLLALAFVLLGQSFGLNVHTFGMMFFVCVLVAICITDFKAKIIPHELTYPAIIAGIIFSIIIKADVLGALAGIGISYILFDFLAFYGLKVYVWFNKPILSTITRFISADAQTKQRQSSGLSWSSKESQIIAKPATQGGSKSAHLYCKGVPLEELEVIGGGDAVLSALISAWLGWRKLIVAVVSGFMLGTILGAIYVFIELKKERLLKTAILPIFYSTFSLFTLAGFLCYFLSVSLRLSFVNGPFVYLLPSAILAGCLLGIIIAGSKISKPFPFGPALAMGAVVALFKHEQ